MLSLNCECSKEVLKWPLLQLTAFTAEHVKCGATLAPKPTENRMEGKSFVYRALGAEERRSKRLKYARRMEGVFLHLQLAERTSYITVELSQTAQKESLHLCEAVAHGLRSSCTGELLSHALFQVQGRPFQHRTERWLCPHTSSHCLSLFSDHVPFNATKKRQFNVFTCVCKST